VGPEISETRRKGGEARTLGWSAGPESGLRGGKGMGFGQFPGAPPLFFFSFFSFCKSFPKRIFEHKQIR